MRYHLGTTAWIEVGEGNLANGRGRFVALVPAELDNAAVPDVDPVVEVEAAPDSEMVAGLKGLLGDHD